MVVWGHATTYGGARRARPGALRWPARCSPPAARRRHRRRTNPRRPRHRRPTPTPTPTSPPPRPSEEPAPRTTRPRHHARRPGSAPASCPRDPTGTARCARPRRRCGTAGSRCPTSCPAARHRLRLPRRQPTPADVIDRSTWQRGCPVGVDDLAWIRLTFWGFDDQRHTGELLANASAADDLVSVFRTLYRGAVPDRADADQHQGRPGRPAHRRRQRHRGLQLPAAHRRHSFSQHAYGLAIDVNSFQNPYVKGDLVLPELASAYLDRDRVRPGMIQPGDDVVRAFAAIGWEWGGDWKRLKDYQHFSLNGPEAPRPGYGLIVPSGRVRTSARVAVDEARRRLQEASWWRSGRGRPTRSGRPSTAAAPTSRCSARSPSASSSACSRPAAAARSRRPGSS